MGKMYVAVQQTCEKCAVVIKAVAHPTRLFIVDELAKHEQCVHALTEMIGATVSTVSDHLAILKRAGLVIDHRRGKHICYSIGSPAVLQLLEYIDCVLRSNARQMSATLQRDWLRPR